MSLDPCTRNGLPSPAGRTVACSEAHDSTDTPQDRGWFKAMRGNEPMELIAVAPLAYVLACTIAHRARWSTGFNRYGLLPGEAMLGDHKACGLTMRQYRTAKQQLERWGFATFKATSKGTIGKLIGTRLFSVLPTSSDNQIANQPTNARQAGDKQPTTNEEGNKNGGRRGELPPLVRKRESWQLLLDEKQLQRRIEAERDACTPDRDLIASLKKQLLQVRAEMKEQPIS